MNKQKDENGSRIQNKPLHDETQQLLRQTLNENENVTRR